LFVLLSKKLARLVDFALEKQKNKTKKNVGKEKEIVPKKITGIEIFKNIWTCNFSLMN
jgi:hypothetical protein